MFRKIIENLESVLFTLFYSLVLISITFGFVRLYDRLFTVVEVRSNQIIKPYILVSSNDTTYIYRNYSK